MSRGYNVLVLSASIGSGHNQAAKATAQQLQRINPLYNVDIVDFMSEDISYFNTLLKETYLKMINVFPNIYDFFYRISQVQRPGTQVQNLLAKIMHRQMAAIVKRYRPDFLIATHPFPCGAAAYLKSTKKLKVPLAAVITDFAVHRLWVHSGVDVYFTATREMEDVLREFGALSPAVYPTGIPIGDGFSRNDLFTANSNEFKTELGLNDNNPTLLVMGGGLGLGGLKPAIEKLKQVKIPLNVLVVTGKNSLLKEQLKNVSRSERHNIKILGYTDQVPELMAISDLLVTKPGALTISEALAVKLPMVLYDPIPGQEIDNASYISSKGAAVWIKSVENLPEQVSRILTSPEQYKFMKTRAGQMGRPYAALAAAEIINQWCCMPQKILSRR